MSTHRYILAKRKGKHLPFLFMLGGLLLLFPLLLPAHALAASSNAAAAPPLTQPQQIVDLAGVSVVRLSLTYNPAKGSTQVSCTTLGTIVASWPAASASDKNTWVLTDGSLLNTSTKNMCVPGGKLFSIRVLASNGFTNNQPTLAQLGLLTCSSSGSCSDTVNGINGPVETIAAPVNNATLLSFHSDTPLPYVDVEQSNGATTPIELANRNNSIPANARSVDPTTLDQFLTPIASTSTPGTAPTTPGATSAPSVEPGMPNIDGNGKITSMELYNTTVLLTSAAIQTLEKQIVLPQGSTLSQQLASNTLSQQWDSGIIQYEQGNNQAAIQALSSIKNASPAFQAPALFITKAQAKLPTTSGTPTPAPSHGKSNSGSFLGIPALWLLVIGLIAAVLVLVLLFLLVSLLFGRKRIERKRELESFKADERRARQRVAGKEKQVPVPQQYSPSAPFYDGAANNPAAASVAEVQCPNCGASVEENAAFCPNCRYNFASPVPPPVPVPAASVQPQTSSISDLPTTEMPNRNGNVSPETETTMPFSVQQLQARNLGLVVITETDRGIKRKHKPNEDSLFALQGARTHNAQPQQYGLFVVADGMGGHANGQDASRTAIQNIIDFMLPRLEASDDLDDAGYKNLLVEGVQQANLAVHQRNLQDHADMGTTMTAALVVGSTAYVANVGDSRTYLYREPEGLRQITHDHSVVASLVEAGIIKPDDIYTHPKRNQIYRSLGEKPGVEVDAFIQPLQANDKLLLCSDGLWDMVRDPEIQRVVSQSSPNLDQIGKNLVQAALAGGGEDNVSVIVVSITEEAGQPAMSGIHLHARPDGVTVPGVPNS